MLIPWTLLTCVTTALVYIGCEWQPLEAKHTQMSLMPSCTTRASHWSFSIVYTVYQDLHSWNVLQSSCIDSVIHTSAQDPFNFVSISFTWARCDRQMRSNPWRLLNWVTMSGPKVKDTPLSFSPHPWMSLSGSDQRRSHRRPGRREVSFTFERKMVRANQYCVFSRSAMLRACQITLDSVTKSQCSPNNKLMHESYTISVSLY